MWEKVTSLFGKVDMTQGRPWEKIVIFTIPMLIGNIAQQLYNTVDSIVVGKYEGDNALAAVGSAGPVFNLLLVLFVGISMGASIMVSQYFGSRDRANLSKTIGSTITLTAAASVLLMVVGVLTIRPLLVLLGADEATTPATAAYMLWTVSCGAVPAILNVVLAYLVRSEGASFHASIGTMSGCLLNIVLDPIFIMPWGLGMGAAGAGLATFLSNCAACAYFFILLYVKRKSTYVCVNPRMLGWNKAIILGICGVGIPASIQNLLNVTGMTILNNFTSEYGADAVAAMGISQKISMVPLQIALGFSQGIMPLISYNYASGNHPRMKKAITFAMKIMMPGLFAVMALFWIFSAGLTGAFMENESIIAYGTEFLRGFSITMPFLGMDFLAVGVFQALGKGKYALVFALLRKIVLEIPALFVLNWLFPLYGLPYAQPFAEMVLAAAAVFMLWRIFRQCNLQQSQ